MAPAVVIVRAPVTAERQAAVVTYLCIVADWLSAVGCNRGLRGYRGWELV
jgi:hypothetical protein